MTPVATAMSQLKGFQRRTVEYAFDRLYGADDSSHRFLVADEVGLGKTLVARGVIAKAVERLRADGVRRIDVIYICANTNIARQNINRLGMREAGREFASRLTLLPTVVKELNEREVNVVALTPRTSFDPRSSEGTWEERRVLYWLLIGAWTSDKAALSRVLKGDVSTVTRFRKMVGWLDPTSIDVGLRAAFLTSLEDRDGELSLSGHPTLRGRFLLAAEQLRGRRPSSGAVAARRALVGELRALLAETCVDALEPDLVILDEFQRFKNLLSGDSEQSALARRLFEYQDEHTQVRTLLLSATPYRMYTLAHEKKEDDHYADFLQTVDFLLDNEDKSLALRKQLDRYRRALYGLADGAGGALLEATSGLRVLLSSVMSRTERSEPAGAGDPMLREISTATLPVERTDVRAFLETQRIASQVGEGRVTEYWKSAPYLLNFMDDYKLVRSFEARLGDPDVMDLVLSSTDALLRWQSVSEYRAVEFANARVRALTADLDAASAWQLLWLPPSLPYYSLGAPFERARKAGFTKRLVFSAWAVVPKALATLLSYESERRLFGGRKRDDPSYATTRQRTTAPLRFQRSGARLTGMVNLTLLYPSVTLAEAGDSRRYPGSDSLGDLLRQVRLAIEPRLRELTSDARTDGAEDDAWYWAAPILLDQRSSGTAQCDWFDRQDLAALWAGGAELTVEQQSWAEHVDRARGLLRGELELGRVPDDLVDVLAAAALAAPGVAALRSLASVTGGDIGEWAIRDAAAAVGWGFRSLFNQPEAVRLIRTYRPQRSLRAVARGGFWRRSLAYAVDGGLGAVLDEYVHMERERLGLFDQPASEQASELASALDRVLGLRTSDLAVRVLPSTAAELASDGPQRYSMRSHFAMRFATDPRGAGRRRAAPRTRSRRIQLALLATRARHDLSRAGGARLPSLLSRRRPLEPSVESRRSGTARGASAPIQGARHQEERGTGVRRGGAGGGPDRRRLGASVRACRVRPTAMVMASCHSGSSTLRGGARIERHVPMLPLSREHDRLEDLRRALVVYRMVFGQPRQDDLMTFLSGHVQPELLEESARAARIDLAPRTT